MSDNAGDLPDLLRAAAAEGQRVLDGMTEPADLDIAGAWEPAISALVDLADVLAPPHDPVAEAIARALLGARVSFVGKTRVRESRVTKLEATIADLRIAASLTTESGECLDVPRERVTELLDEIELLRAAEVVRDLADRVDRIGALERELERLRAIAGGGRCVECGQVEPIAADGRLAPHHDAGTDELCVGSDERGHEPPNLTVRVLDNDDRRELERLRARDETAKAVVRAAKKWRAGPVRGTQHAAARNKLYVALDALARAHENG